MAIDAAVSLSGYRTATGRVYKWLVVMVVWNAQQRRGFYARRVAKYGTRQLSEPGLAVYGDHHLAAQVVTVAIVAVAKVTRAARYINIARALGIRVAPPRCLRSTTVSSTFDTFITCECRRWQASSGADTWLESFESPATLRPI